VKKDNYDFDKYIVSIDYNHQKFVRDPVSHLDYLDRFGFKSGFTTIVHKYYCSQDWDSHTKWCINFHYS
jgi:hypothetical protein